MKQRVSTVFAFLIVSLLFVTARTESKQQVTRTVRGQELISTSMPAVRLKFADKFKYVGGQSFILYDVANAEQHFFVDADKEKRVKSLYWVQFEGYLPSNSYKYDYEATNIAKIGGLDFIADAYARRVVAAEGRPNSDGKHAQALLESKGYRLEGSEVMFQRLVHLLDESKRSELMIIYAEDLSSTGFTSADLAPNGRAAAKWDPLRKELLNRAIKGFHIIR